jgi:hypothetical protein
VTYVIVGDSSKYFLNTMDLMILSLIMHKLLAVLTVCIMSMSTVCGDERLHSFGGHGSRLMDNGGCRERTVQESSERVRHASKLGI